MARPRLRMSSSQVDGKTESQLNKWGPSLCQAADLFKLNYCIEIEIESVQVSMMAREN